MADANTKSLSFRVLAFLLLFYPQKIENNDQEGLPNVILLVVDNLGFSDLSYFGNTTVKTPNIDRLAKDGVLFTRWYSQSSSTSTRASILTGRLPIKTGILKSRYLPYKAIPSLASIGGLQPDQITIAEALKTKGYETAFVGQWGMGLGRKNSLSPLHQGFDHWYGVPTLHNKFCIQRTSSNDTNQTTLLDDNDDYPEEDLPTPYLIIVCSFTIILGGLTVLWLSKKIDMMMFVCLAAPEVILLYLVYFSFNLMDFVYSRNCVLYRDGKIIEQPYVANNMTLRFTRETIKILNGYSSKKSPFFIMHSYLKLHRPLYVSDAFSNCSENDLFLCSLLEVDWSIGKIIGTLGSLGKENDTLVILTSTGGPCVDVDGDCSRGNGILVTEEQMYEEFRSGGNNVWEGDIRVPTIIRWKGKLQPGQTINITTSCMDILPTLMDLTNQSSEGLGTDGKSLVSLLGNSSAVTQHPILYHYTDVYKPSAVTQGKYKFVFITQSDEITLYHDPPLVFNMEADLRETSPLSLDEFPETLLSQVLTVVEQHLANRTDKGTSQFDNFFLPWLFPCVNMPSCLQVNKEDDDFSELLDNTDDIMFQRHDDATPSYG